MGRRDLEMSRIHGCTEKETDLRGRKGNKQGPDVKRGENLREEGRAAREILPGRNDGDWPATSPENGARREWRRREKEKGKNEAEVERRYL